MIVDAHHHFWDPARAEYPWMSDELAAIRRPFGPADLAPLLAASGIDGTILVQARSAIDETEALLATAAATPSCRFHSPARSSQSQKRASHHAAQATACFTRRVSPLGDRANRSPHPVPRAR